MLIFRIYSDYMNVNIYFRSIFFEEPRCEIWSIVNWLFQHYIISGGWLSAPLSGFFAYLTENSDKKSQHYFFTLMRYSDSVIAKGTREPAYRLRWPWRPQLLQLNVQKNDRCRVASCHVCEDFYRNSIKTPTRNRNREHTWPLSEWQARRVTRRRRAICHLSMPGYVTFWAFTIEI